MTEFVMLMPLHVVQCNLSLWSFEFLSLNPLANLNVEILFSTVFRALPFYETFSLCMPFNSSWPLIKLIYFMQLDDRAVDAVMGKLFKNYKTWCKFLGRKHSLRYDSICINFNWCVFQIFYFCFMLYFLDLMFVLHYVFLKCTKSCSM